MAGMPDRIKKMKFLFFLIFSLQFEIASTPSFLFPICCYTPFSIYTVAGLFINEGLNLSASII